MMSKSETSSTASPKQDSVAVAFGADADRVERAVAASDFEDSEALIREATLQRVAEILDELLECPRDGCEETFLTEAERRGHLGSESHALDVPEGDIWCGYCGYGPASWRQVNAHHGASPSHDGDVIRLDEEPDEDDLVLDLNEIPDHKDQQLLERLYREHDGNVTEMCRAHEFDVHQGTVRSWLIKFEIHAVTPQGTEGDEVPEYRDRERLEELYRRHDGNVSAVHRAMDVDAPYRTVHNWLLELEIHDPTTRDAGRESGAGDEADDSEESRDSHDSDESDEAEDTEKPTPGRGPSAEGEDEDKDVVDEEVLALIRPDDPADVDSFEDLKTPGWLAEASFYVALDMSETAEEFAENLGWGEPADLERMVGVLGRDDELAGGPET
jgi:transposase-like protein